MGSRPPCFRRGALLSAMGLVAVVALGATCYHKVWAGSAPHSFHGNPQAVPQEVTLYSGEDVKPAKDVKLAKKPEEDESIGVEGYVCMGCCTLYIMIGFCVAALYYDPKCPKDAIQSSPSGNDTCDAICNCLQLLTCCCKCGATCEGEAVSARIHYVLSVPFWPFLCCFLKKPAAVPPADVP